MAVGLGEPGLEVPCRESAVRAELLACGVALGLAAFSAGFAGCAQEGTTPTCDNNVTKDGILNKKANPCESFGKCYGTYKSSTEVDGTKYDTVEVCGSAQISDGTCGSTYGDAMVCCCAALSHVDL